MRIYHYLSGQLLLQTISVKLENSPFLKLYVDFFKLKCFCDVSLCAACCLCLDVRPRTAAFQICETHSFSESLLSLASLCQASVSGPASDTSSLQSPGCNAEAMRCREIPWILLALNMDENHGLIEEAGIQAASRIFRFVTIKRWSMHQQSEAHKSQISPLLAIIFLARLISLVSKWYAVVSRRSFAVVNGGYFRLLVFQASDDIFVTDSVVTSGPKLVFVYAINSEAGSQLSPSCWCLGIEESDWAAALELYNEHLNVWSILAHTALEIINGHSSLPQTAALSSHWAQEKDTSLVVITRVSVTLHNSMILILMTNMRVTFGEQF